MVPLTHLITLEMAKQTPISKKILKAGLELLSPKHSFLSTFLLLERLKPDSYWKPYLDCLP
jgi:histone-lysine N-methyltransferase SETD3